jgi:hypothetical protein
MAFLTLCLFRQEGWGCGTTIDMQGVVDQLWLNNGVVNEEDEKAKEHLYLCVHF